ncbi:hypothetical protein GOP47_0001946 [Adiantum capillus-veneris]|uniref:ABC1 atypical kinase-like domain-containing protein n=1 Tax=Adiantum capillus-veneris TaxID=13818 RepID=A0A9D4VAQ5_ADICA|nr:hypothetical protein GOP47_0001946 [Adiantum capillus-veneris]
MCHIDASVLLVHMVLQVNSTREEHQICKGSIKLVRMLSSRATNAGIEKRLGQSTRCDLAQADASTISLDVWSGTVKSSSGKVNGQNRAQDSMEIAGMAPSKSRNVSEVQKRSKFWQILENDKTLMKNAFEGFKEGLPSVNKTMQKAVTLSLWEDASAIQSINIPVTQCYRQGLSGLDLAVADFIAVKGYLLMALGWLRALQIPLEPCYDPELIADYFNRRPHVLLFRVLQVSAVFGSALFQLQLEKFLKPGDWTESRAQRRGAELIKGALVSLGPTFIKVGQSLSTRPDLIGTIPAKVFSEMQDNLPPFSTCEAVSIIEEELGGSIGTIFSDFSEKPVAAASFGQVYKGRTIDGHDVAVKVQRPNLLLSIALDIYILRIGLDVLRKVAKRRSDLKLYADELGHGFFGELDYIQEANNAKEFKEAHSKLMFVEVPETLRGLSTRRVLTMKWVEGDRPVDMLLVAEMPNPHADAELRQRQLKAKQRLFSMVNKGVEASLVQLFDSGLLHADPHPGNILYTAEGKMVFLDFGLVCRMKREHQVAMMASVTHIVNADWDSFVLDLASMDVLPAYINRREIAQELAQSLGETVPQEGIPDIKFSKVLARVLEIALRHQFRMPPYFVLVLRSIASLEGLALAVDPDFQVFASSYPFVLQKLLTDDSVPLKRVLSSLVLDRKKRFRWDRLASFATIAQQHTEKRIALETGVELKLMSVSDGKVVNPGLIQLLANLLLSEKGTIFRQLILEADTFDLARTYNSQEAAALRRSLATAIAQAIYHYGQRSMEKHAHTGWTSFTIVCYALAVAAHRLVVAISFNMLNFSPKSSASAPAPAA